jgi:hypothetical protein
VLDCVNVIVAVIVNVRYTAIGFGRGLSHPQRRVIVMTVGYRVIPFIGQVS